MSEPGSEPASAPTDTLSWSPTAGPPTPACAWCGSGFGPDDRRDSGRIRCRRCGAATTSPWPTPQQLDAAYGDWYRPSTRFGAVGDALLRRTRARLARRVDRLAPAGSVLDVGAGDGTLVDALHSRGREALGLERVESGPGITTGGVGELGGQWAAVVFWHSLEHLPEPGAALADAVGLLAPRGLVILALPNLASRQARRFGDDWFALDLPRHLVHLPADTVLARLGELGLRVERVSYLRGGQVAFGWAHGFVARLPGHPDLYAAIRSPAARAEPMTVGDRVIALGAGLLLAPLAIVAAVVEVLGRRGGTVYVEARR